jgi:DNA-binding transcriptional LysR family regulator
LSAAGESLGYTQPGITRIINTLEEELGFKLLVRTRNGVVLTENGKTMLPIFREIVRASNSARELAGEIRGVLSGTLVIGSYYSVSAMQLPEIIGRFKADYPGIRIKLREGGNGEFARWLSNKSVDCCFAIQPANNVPCDWIPVIQDELMAWLPPDHPRIHDKSYPVKELENEPSIATSPDQDTEIDRMFRTQGIAPVPVYSTADAYAAYCMVEAGLGVSVNDNLFSDKWGGNVVALPFDPPQKITLGIALPSLKEASPAMRRFLEYIPELRSV